MLRNGRRLINVQGTRRVAPLNELNEPISLVRASRLPDSHTGYDLTLSYYANAWAKISFGERMLNHRENDDQEKYSHIFTIRNDESLSIEVRDYVVWGNILYRVVTTQIVNQFRDRLRIKTLEHLTLDSATFRLVFDPMGSKEPSVDAQGNAILQQSAEIPPVRESTENPFWETSPTPQEDDKP